MDDILSLEIEGIKLVNLCPHPITLMLPKGQSEEIPQSGRLARVVTDPEVETHIAGVPVEKATYGQVYGLPKPQKDTFYIVSAQVLNALDNSREDVVAVGRKVTGRHKETIGVSSFRRKF